MLTRAGDRADQCDTEQCTEQRLSISLQGQQGLGCSICKGPVEKPGIFIQSTKAGRLAREVGLRPGDQILECNGASFRNIEFGDAVYHLKSSRKLELVVRKGAGLELFPSESSGYDSSASSSVGDSPASSSSAGSDKDRSDHSELGLDLNQNTVKLAKLQKLPKLPRPPDPPPPVRVTTPQNNNNHEAERRKLQVEQDRLRRESEALSEERRRFEEEKRLLRSSIGSRSNLVGSKSVSDLTAIHLPPSPKTHNMPSSPKTTVTKSPSASSNVSVDSSSSSSGGSLAAALQSEIKRRAQKANNSSPGSDQGGGSKETLENRKPFITEKNEKHDLLIAEFKKAHRKMFSSSPEVSDGEVESRVSAPPPPPPKPGDKTGAQGKPKAPPPPPKSALSSLSSSPSPRPPLSTFKPVVTARSSSLTLRSLGTPGIPTPDYDITPDRSPHGHRKLFLKHKTSGGKHIAPPTMESIHRAKSLSSLVECGLEEGPRHKSSRAPQDFKPLKPALSQSSLYPAAPQPGVLKPALSQSALSQSALYHSPGSPSLSSLSRTGGQYRSSSALYEAATRKEATLLDGPTSISSSRLSTQQPEFSKRHPDTGTDQLESFQVDIVKPQTEVKPPSIYFEKSSATDSTEQHRFEFLPRPCDPTTIPSKEDGEEARIASKDYRAVNATLGKALEKTRFNKVETAGKKKELGEAKISIRSFGLKKAPAPMPPILRKI